MEVQLTLVLFTLFVCLSSGIFGGISALAFVDKGKEIQKPAVITALVALIIGAFASFLHLQHWTRIFNGFGHLSSGITQEFIGVVVLAIVMLIYLYFIVKRDEIPKWLAGLGVVVSLAMVIVMASAYLMEARPAWDSFALVFFYLAQALLFGSVGIWVLASFVKDKEVTLVAINATIITAILQLIADAVYVFFVGSLQFPTVGIYFDPTTPTIAPVDASGNLAAAVTTGEYAALFWIGIIAVGAVVALILAFIKRKEFASGKDLNWSAALPISSVALVAVLAGGICSRVLIYWLGNSVYMFY